MTVPVRLDHARVLAVATKAIGDRLGHPAPWAVLAISRVTDAPGGYDVHVNSGGNAITVASAFRAASYEVVDPPTLLDGSQSGAYGQRVRVRLPEWAINEISAKLRLASWEPQTVYACECQPEHLCAAHAEVRAVDHYGATG